MAFIYNLFMILITWTKIFLRMLSKSLRKIEKLIVTAEIRTRVNRNKII